MLIMCKSSLYNRSLIPLRYPFAVVVNIKHLISLYIHDLEFLIWQRNLTHHCCILLPNPKSDVLQEQFTFFFNATAFLLQICRSTFVLDILYCNAFWWCLQTLTSNQYFRHLRNQNHLSRKRVGLHTYCHVFECFPTYFVQNSVQP
jgi:hypothetical protein